MAHSAGHDREMNMPTGYTHAIADGITFEQYAMNCARAFGALVTLRDEPNAPIPEKFEPSDFYQKQLESTHETLSRVAAWTDAQIEAEYRTIFASRVEAHEQRLANAASLRAKYESMLAQVRAWEAPTPDHVEYKAFMEKQITDSVAFDCNTSYAKWPEQQEPAAWHAEWISELRERISRYESEHRKEVERAHTRTLWIRAIRESLKA